VIKALVTQQQKIQNIHFKAANAQKADMYSKQRKMKHDK